jgi:TolB-like protein
MLILSMGNACIQEKSVKSINDLSMTSYVDHDVTWNALKSGGLAIFPTRVNVGKKIEAQIIENLLNKEIRRRFAGIHVVDYEEMQRFSSKSKRKKWIEMLVSHSSPHSIRGTENLDALSIKLGVRYFLQTDIRISGVEGGAEHVRIFGRLWDGKTREILWSGYGEARGYVYLFFPAIPASFEKTSYRAIQGLVKRIPVGKSDK